MTRDKSGLLMEIGGEGHWKPWCTGDAWSMEAQKALADSEGIEYRIFEDYSPSRTMSEALDAARRRRRYGQEVTTMSEREYATLSCDCITAGDHWVSSLELIEHQYAADVSAVRLLPIGVSLAVAEAALGAARLQRDTARRDLELALTAVLAGDL